MNEKIFKFLSKNGSLRTKEEMIRKIKRRFYLNDEEASEVYKEWRKKYVRGLIK